jgi:Domain of unknown function (DUF4279)
MKDFQYLIALDICPRDADGQWDYTQVSELLNMRPTNITKKGQKWVGRLGLKGLRYDRWYWRYATRVGSFEQRDVSEHLVSFLKKLPTAKGLWAKINQHCNCEIYLPLERTHFQIEVDLTPDVFRELLIRNLKLHVSTLSRQDDAR